MGKIVDFKDRRMAKLCAEAGERLDREDHLVIPKRCPECGAIIFDEDTEGFIKCPGCKMMIRVVPKFR